MEDVCKPDFVSVQHEVLLQVYLYFKIAVTIPSLKWFVLKLLDLHSVENNDFHLDAH